MKQIDRSSSGRPAWLFFALAAAFVSAALRRWQLSSAFEADTGLAIPGAQASVILTCVLVMSAAWSTILAVGLPSRERRWDRAFLDTGDRAYPILMLLAAFLALAAVPFFLITGIGQWRAYQAAVAAQSPQVPSSNGLLAIATALGALLSFLGLLQLARDGFHAGRHGKGGFSATLPGIAGCIWLMESFRGHAADPVRWDYVPLLLAIVCGMLLYMDFSGMSTSAARPRRLLWLAAMAPALSAPALVSALAEGPAGDVLLLSAQVLTAFAVLWRLPPYLEAPPHPKEAPLPAPGDETIQEEIRDE